MSAAGTITARTWPERRIRNGALGLAAVALAFYFGFIALLSSAVIIDGRADPRKRANRKLITAAC